MGGCCFKDGSQFWASPDNFQQGLFLARPEGTRLRRLPSQQAPSSTNSRSERQGRSPKTGENHCGICTSAQVAQDSEDAHDILVDTLVSR